MLVRGSSRRSSLTTVKRYQLQRSALAPAYLGIALPLDLRTGLLSPPPPPEQAAPRQASTDSETEQPSSKDASLSCGEFGRWSGSHSTFTLFSRLFRPCSDVSCRVRFVFSVVRVRVCRRAGVMRW